jgi:hypothetical protein
LDLVAIRCNSLRRFSNCAISGPLPRLNTIVLNGTLTDDEIGTTFLHELAHRWLVTQAGDAPTALERFAQPAQSLSGPGASGGGGGVHTSDSLAP